MQCQSPDRPRIWPTRLLALQMTDGDNDRHQRPLLVWPRYTMCRQASNNFTIHFKQGLNFLNTSVTGVSALLQVLCQSYISQY